MRSCCMASQKFASTATQQPDPQRLRNSHYFWAIAQHALSCKTNVARTFCNYFKFSANFGYCFTAVAQSDNGPAIVANLMAITTIYT